MRKTHSNKGLTREENRKQWQMLAHEVESGKPVKLFVKRYSVSRATVHDVCKRLGVVVPKIKYERTA